MADPTSQRPGYQRAPHYPLLLGCGAAAAVLAVIGAVVNFGVRPEAKVPVPPGMSARPSGLPTNHPTSLPTNFPTRLPTNFPTSLPTGFPTSFPTGLPSHIPTSLPSFPTQLPTDVPTGVPGAPGRTS